MVKVSELMVSVIVGPPCLPDSFSPALSVRLGDIGAIFFSDMSSFIFSFSYPVPNEEWGVSQTLSLIPLERTFRRFKMRYKFFCFQQQTVIRASFARRGLSLLLLRKPQCSGITLRGGGWVYCWREKELFLCVKVIVQIYSQMFSDEETLVISSPCVRMSFLSPSTI